MSCLEFELSVLYSNIVPKSFADLYVFAKAPSCWLLLLTYIWHGAMNNILFFFVHFSFRQPAGAAFILDDFRVGKIKTGNTE